MLCKRRKKKRKPQVIKLSLDTWFLSKEELLKGLIDFYTAEGAEVQAYDEESLLLNGKRYYISTRTHLTVCYPYQEQRLTEAELDS